jgi:hypothetical protein
MLQQALHHTYVESSCGASWGCWGGNKGGTSVCIGTGSSIEADCISQGDAGIEYGLNGVCHQIANRILAAASIELPPAIPQVRATRILYRGPFGWNPPWHSPTDWWPNRKLSCAAPPPRQSPGPVGPSGGSGSFIPNLSSGSGLMSFGAAEHDEPDPRSELYALIEAAGLRNSVSRRMVDDLVDMQATLHAKQGELAQMLHERAISRKEYLSRLDAVMRDAARAGEGVLGFDDFHKVFGEFRVHNIIDVNAFIGASGAR